MRYADTICLACSVIELAEGFLISLASSLPDC